MNNRFDYVKYDEQATRQQAAAKRMCMALEQAINELGSGRAQSLALTALEECYMWIGKAVRDGQLARDEDTELEESRGPG